MKVIILIKYKLGDVVEVISERVDNPADCEHDKFVGLEHYISGDVEITKYGETSLLKSAMKVFKSGDILIARRNVYLKRASIVKFDGITSGDSIVLRVKNELLRCIIPFVLNTDEFWGYAEKFSDGTMSKRLSPKVLLEYEFILPQLDMQEKLAELLWTANETKEAYKKLLNLTDVLVKSQFIEMFEMTNLPEKVMDELCTRSAQNGFYRKGAENNPNTPIIKMKELFANESMENARNMDQVNMNEKERNNFVLTPNDLLFGRRSLVLEGAGKCRRAGNVKGFIAFESSLLRVTLNPQIVLPRYMQSWFESEAGINAIESIRSVTTIAGIRGSDLKTLRVPVPPLVLQEQFISFAEQTDKSKFELKQNIDNLEKTIKALMSKNFSL